ncbi:hypothetical protein [uncultured Klebsiella sp.]|uniref:hypothetical protein n=1 Tax=uncultured Klebsiella sp. TaxID=284011 RepID=UPI0028051C46|nr:hypothetical protein [uncultured Klebsiella sp.]
MARLTDRHQPGAHHSAINLHNYRNGDSLPDAPEKAENIAFHPWLIHDRLMVLLGCKGFN